MPLHSLPDPPDPPQAPRRFRLYPYQWVGLALLAMLPLLALAGVFGETWAETSVSSSDLAVTVRYPSSYRYKQLNSIEVRVRNTSPAVLDTARVAVDTAFANGFSSVRAIPALIRAYETEVLNLRPNESRLVVIELQGERYGRHAGLLRVIASDTLQVPLSITIFP